MLPSPIPAPVKLGLLLCATSLPLAVSLGCARAPARPSLLLLTFDALRPDQLASGGGGDDLPATPHLDALVAESLYFEGAVAPVGRSLPSLASLLTGGYPHATGVRTQLDGLRPDVVTLGEVLRQQGYQTLAVVSNTQLHPNRDLDRGFEAYDYGESWRTASMTRTAAARAIAYADPQRPLFAWVHFGDAALPFDPEPELAEAFDPGYRGRYREHFGRQPRSGELLSMYRTHPPGVDPGELAHGGGLPERVRQHLRRLYAADLRQMDAELPSLLSVADGMFGSRLVVVVAGTYGLSLGEHGYFLAHGDYVYNASTHVPLAIRLPASHPLHRRGRCAGWVSLVDVAPTLLAILDAGPEGLSATAEGRSLTACLRGEPLPEAPVFSESGRSRFAQLVEKRARNDVAGRLRAVTRGSWKLIWNPFQALAGRESRASWELYDLASDPGETRDLYAPEQPAVAPLRRELRRFLLAGVRDAAAGDAPESPEQEALRAFDDDVARSVEPAAAPR